MSKKWTDSKAALTEYCMSGNVLVPLTKFSLWAEMGSVVECLPHTPKTLGLMPHTTKTKRKSKKETLFHPQIKQLQDKLTGYQGRGYKKTDPQIRLESLCDTEEKHLKAQGFKVTKMGHLKAVSCAHLEHRRFRGRFVKVL